MNDELRARLGCWSPCATQERKPGLVHNPNPAPTPYPDLNAVLRELISSMQTILGANFIGAYLQGSFAVGDFDEHSDVDWIVATKDELSTPEVEALQVMHPRVRTLDNPWAQHLEGSYFPLDVLRDHTQAGRPLWYLDHGSYTLIRSDHCNTVLVRWVVRDCGVPLAGPDPATLVDPIPVRRLRQTILATICDWGQDILDNPARYNNRFYQAFIVLNYCRMLHDLRNGCPGSKLAGATWAKKTLDPAWRDLIDRAWETRRDATIHQPADPADYAATLDFVRFIMDESRQYAAAHDLLP